MAFPYASADKESTCNAGDLGSIPGLGRSPAVRERLPTLVLWPGEFHGLYSPWVRKELDTIELLGRKAMTNLDSDLKSRDIILSTKVWIVQSMVFLVIIYGFENKSLKKSEH